MLYQRTEQGLRRFQGELPEAVAAAIERADEKAIVAALGDERFAGEYLYHVQADGRELLGISAEGAFEMARLLGNIEVLPEAHTEKDGSGYYVLVRVRDNLRHVTLLGAARQPLRNRAMAAGRVGVEMSGPIDHAWTVAVSKAQRNGILRLVSPQARQRIVEEFLARVERQAAQAEPGQQPRLSESPSQVDEQAMSGQVIGAPPSSLSAADFAAGCRQKGYQTSGEVCSTLGFSDKRELVRFGLARALEKLPDRNAASPEESDLDDVDLGF